MLRGLGSKTLLVLFLVAAAYTALSWAVLERIVRPAFDDLEQAAATRNLERARQALDGDLRHLLATAGDWSNWDDTRAFVLGDKPDYVDENLAPAVFVNLGVHFAYFFDQAGGLVFARSVDPATGAEAPVAGFGPDAVSSGRVLLDHGAGDGTHTGFAPASGETVMVVSRPIFDSEARGPAAGTLVMGRRLGPDALAELAERTQTRVRLLPEDRVDAGLLQRVRSNGNIGVLVSEDDRVLAYAALPGFAGPSGVLVESVLPRDIAAVGGRAIDFAVGMLLVAAVADLFVVWLLLHRLIVGPIRTLTRHIAASDRGQRPKPLGWRRGDEIGTLAATYDRLRTASNEQVDALHRAMERLTAADAAKTAFFANMSHELRTPLNAVIGFSDVIRSEMLGPLPNARYREYAADINASGQHLLRLVNQILDLSKAESEQLELNLEEVDLEECVDHAVRMMRVQAERAGVALERRIEPGLPLLHADRLRLSEVLINLLSNAVKFTDPGGRVSLAAWVHPDGRVGIRVTDTGIGMAAEDIPRALAPFVQLAHGRERSIAGTGLGLPLAKRLTELHGGSFVVLSAVGEGTTVTITLPAPGSPSPAAGHRPGGGRPTGLAARGRHVA